MKEYFTDTSTRMIRFRDDIDHELMMSCISEFSQRYPNLEITYIGESMLGRGIPMITLGKGSREAIYIGAHHGMESITSAVLLTFINDYCENLKGNVKIYGSHAQSIDEAVRIHIIPMLNPDGVDYSVNGVSEDNILYERLISMNSGNTDFTNWQANARGVDLNHNYDAGFYEYKKIEYESGIMCGGPTRFSGEWPESEPEVGFLCNYMRFNENISVALTLHSQGEEIYYTSVGESNASYASIAKIIGNKTGYRVEEPEGMAAYGGFTDWCISKLNKPSFTIECGKGKNPLPISDYFSIYTKLREILYRIPFMV